MMSIFCRTFSENKMLYSGIPRCLTTFTNITNQSHDVTTLQCRSLTLFKLFPSTNCFCCLTTFTKVMTSRHRSVGRYTHTPPIYIKGESTIYIV